VNWGDGKMNADSTAKEGRDRVFVPTFSKDGKLLAYGTFFEDETGVVLRKPANWE